MTRVAFFFNVTYRRAVQARLCNKKLQSVIDIFCQTLRVLTLRRLSKFSVPLESLNLMIKCLSVKESVSPAMFLRRSVPTKILYL